MLCTVGNSQYSSRMTYKVLARKWRPQKFSDMIGQEHVLRALINALDNQRLHHAYVFTGMRGVGKTTIARIFAKCLNCETNGVSASPCGECGSCKDIEAGRFFDLIEVDAASRTKVDETRELLENVPYAPASGRYKVYLIDEVHMFSTHSFNALLKTLEEPPEHVKFLLATTDPQKLPLTVLSRCLQFNLKRMPQSRLSDYLQQILSDEKIGYQVPAIDIIARASEGSVRDALSLVEQAAAFGQGEVRQEEVESMLGRVSVDRLIDLLELLKAGDAEPLFEKVEALAEYAPDYNELLAEFTSIVHRVAMLHELPSKASEATSPSEQRLLDLSSTIEGDELQLMYQIASHARRDIGFAADQREAFDMALLRMLAFAPQQADASNPAAQAKPGGVVGKRKTSDVKSVAAEAAVTPDTKADSLMTAEPTRSAPIESAPAAPAKSPDKPAQASQKVEPVAVEPIELSTINAQSWHDVTARLGISGMPRQLAEHSVLSKVDGNKIQIELDADADHLNSPSFIQRLQDALSASSGVEINLVVDKGQDGAALVTPAKIVHQQQEDAMSAAKAAINDDPLVKQLLEEVDGTVDQNSVKPIDQ
jgi:DNA polymerase-3 subunit gamma/tau